MTRFAFLLVALLTLPAASVAAVEPDCDDRPRLIALHGGGAFELNANEQTEVPYGVPFVYRRVIARAVAVELEVWREGERIQQRTFELDPDECVEFAVPEMSPGVPFRLVERAIVPLDAATRARVAAAFVGTRREVLALLRAGRWDRLMVQSQSESAMLAAFDSALRADFADLVMVDSLARTALRVNGRLVPLADTASVLLGAAAAGFVSFPMHFADAVQVVRDLGGLDIDKDCSALTNRERNVLRASIAHLQPLGQATSLTQLPDLYDVGVLPLDRDALLETERLLVNGCGQDAEDSAIDLILPLAEDPLTMIDRAIARTIAVIERAYGLSAVDIFGGMTTTLQRFGQVDVVNAHLREREEDRLVGLFSFYPFALAYGAERIPDGLGDLGDRLTASIGYTLKTLNPGDQDDLDDERGFVVQAQYRLNPAVSIGYGVVFLSGEEDDYWSVALDLGVIPGLEDLLGREP